MSKIVGLLAFLLMLQGCNSFTATSVEQGTNDSTGSSTAPGDNSNPSTPTNPTNPTTPVDNSALIPTKCSNSLPATALAVDVSNPKTVVGTGTAASCTFAALKTAVAAGGIIKFNCGTGKVTIPVTATLNLLTNVNTVIDGGGLVTLDGQSAVQIFRFYDANFMTSSVRVTLQNLTVINGKTTPKEVIPTAPAPCSQGYDDGQGGALYMRNGNLSIINSTFSNNQAALIGPDTGGGAVYILGSKSGLVIANSIFTNNKGSNAGGVGGLFAQLEIYSSKFEGNVATGNGANYNDQSMCSVQRPDGQYQAGSGGNGGAIYQDGGRSTNVILCGNYIVNNKAGTKANGGGVFMTSNDFTGTITVQDSTITGNTGGSWQNAPGGTLGSAFGINAKSSSVINSTLQK